MRAHAHARDVCSDSLFLSELRAGWNQSSFFNLETQNSRATQISKKKPLSAGNLCVTSSLDFSSIRRRKQTWAQLHKEFGTDSCAKPSKIKRKKTINLLFVVTARINSITCKLLVVTCKRISQWIYTRWPSASKEDIHGPSQT